MNHLLVGCVFAQDFWFLMLRGVGLQSLSPQPTAPSFDDWWSDANSRVEVGRASILWSSWLLGVFRTSAAGVFSMESH